MFAPLDLPGAPGRPLTVMGPSGAGKSSLLAWLTGVLPAGLRGEGDVLLDDVPVLDRCRPTGADWASCSRTTCCFRI